MKEVIAWFVKNHVAANLCMAFILITGYLVLPLIERKIIPEIGVDRIEIVVALPGSAPSQVERTVSRRIEQSLIGIDGILDVTTHARKGASFTSIDVSPDVTLSEVVSKVRSRVDAVALPSEASRPVVSEVEIIEPVLSLALSGYTDKESLSSMAELVVGQLMMMPNVSLVYLQEPASRNFQVELSESAMRSFGLSYTEIINSIRNIAIDITGATLNTEEGEISIVGESPVNSTETLENLAVRSYSDGARVVLGNVAGVSKRYYIDDRYKKFDNKNVVYIGINRAQHEDLIALADDVHTFIVQAKDYLPEGVELQISNDVSKEVKGRIEMLSANAISGFILVLFILLLFMNLRLSFWTSLGIPISFLGAFATLYFLDMSLNMVSLFAFILVLGIVVDDAIIVGESVYAQHEKSNFGVSGALQGTLEVYRPVIFAVLTTMIAFAPMLFMPGEEGQLVSVVSIVVIAVLAFSLFESLFILPSHLAMVKNNQKELLPIVNDWQTKFSGYLDRLITRRYSPALEKALYWRYTTVMLFITVFLICLALLAFRWVSMNVVSQIEGDAVVVRMSMIAETPQQETEQALIKLEQVAFQLRSEINDELGFEQITHIAAEINPGSTTSGKVTMFLNPSEVREISSNDIEKRVREKFGTLPHLSSLTISSTLVNLGAQIDLELSHTNIEALKNAAEELTDILAKYNGVIASWDNFTQGKQEIGFRLKDEAGDMGVTSAQVAAQIRQAFHGEVLQIYDEVGNRLPVIIGYPEQERSSLWFFENLEITIKDGSKVPLYAIADLNYSNAPAVIVLHNGLRSVRVQAKLDEKISVAQVMNSLERDYLNQLDAKHPGMTWKRAGGQKRSEEVLSYLYLAYPISLLAMYLLMATLFASYWQPLMIMCAIPFGIVGALIGHILMGVEVTLWSLVGIIAVSGVVVNDNLVLVDYINRRREEGINLLEAIRSAGVSRFRPILLTSLTTFLGLVPLMFESSIQAQFLIPMAVSLGYGVMFATTISLVLVPCLYAILYDLSVYVEDKQLFATTESFLRRFFRSDASI